MHCQNMIKSTVILFAVNTNIGGIDAILNSNVRYLDTPTPRYLEVPYSGFIPRV